MIGAESNLIHESFRSKVKCLCWSMDFLCGWYWFWVHYKHFICYYKCNGLKGDGSYVFYCVNLKL